MLSVVTRSGVVAIALVAFTMAATTDPSTIAGAKCTGVLALVQCSNCNLTFPTYTSIVPQGVTPNEAEGPVVQNCVDEHDMQGNACVPTPANDANPSC
jgi:hypothetical protein